MLNILELIRKYHFFLLFIFLEIITFSITINNRSNQKTFFVNSSNFITSNVYTNYFRIKEYFGLRKENEHLLEENIKLKNDQIIFDKIDILKLQDTIKNRQYTYISGQVVKNSILNQNNYITINRGKNDGIIKDMAVVNSQGVIGIVTNVSQNYCVALSVLNNLNRIGCKLKNSNYFGSAIWDGKNYQQLILDGIPNHIVINKGDTVTTSGYGFIFPPNINIGIIDTMWKNPQNTFYTIIIDLTTDLKKISEVYLIKNTQQIEQKNLQLETSEMFE